MSFLYRITQHRLEHDQAGLITFAYSGRGVGLNNPAECGRHGVEGVEDAGPIPPGWYTIGDPVESHGGFALPLIPDPQNMMFGRGSFLIHGDLITAWKNPQRASLGCIIAGRVPRWAVHGSKDRRLQVVP